MPNICTVRVRVRAGLRRCPLVIRKQYIDREGWSAWCDVSVLVTRSGEKEVIGRRVVVGAKPRRVDGSLRRGGSDRKTFVCGSNIVGEKAIIERLVLVEANSRRVGCSLWRGSSHRDTCILWEQHHRLLVASFGQKAVNGRSVGGSKITACRRLASSRRL